MGRNEGSGGVGRVMQAINEGEHQGDQDDEDNDKEAYGRHGTVPFIGTLLRA
jgi:hypothetical protein